ncbi:serine/threonine-protein kinase [Actinomadura fibrosa]|uniref:Serine/threonine-protein kinase n=1 Tax=Actinomadura fibrosa TaxID=111802 RepID=A0ABW2Y1Y7_9ACTN|nr:serine/threonine-protein kinase [Actinomadura fibrosa]
MRPEDPSQIGGYPVIARLGAGGMGQVYLGLSGGGRHVALKVIREDFEDPQALARFRREVLTVERVRSPFAAAMVGAGLDARPYWLATEYVPGPTLRQAVAQHGPLPPDTCLRLLATLALGLLGIHRQGVQHRDLKPGNVILAPNGPRLIDFGIARGDGQTQITQTGAWNGTPGYVAPEVVREQAPVPASDMFSLAGTIAYAATGRPPFGSGRIEAVIHRTLSGDIDVAGADPRVAELVRLMAAKDPAERPTPEALLQRIAVTGPLPADPVYRSITSTAGPPPASVADAVAFGLVPAERTRTSGGSITMAGDGTGRRRTAVIAAAAGMVAVVLAAAVGARYAFDGDGGEGGTGGRPTAGTTSNGGTGSSPSTVAGGTSPRATGGTGTGTGGVPRNDILIKQPSDDFNLMAWKKEASACQPAVRPEDDALAGDLQYSAPRTPVTGRTADLAIRFKYTRKPGYYMTAQVRAPGSMVGSSGAGAAVTSKPKEIPSDDGYLELKYPADFRWDSNNPPLDLAKGDWTVVWLHVHPNGDAYYMACDGFSVQ